MSIDVCMYYVRMCVCMCEMCARGERKDEKRNSTFKVKFLEEKKKELLKPNKRTTKKKPERWEEKTEVCTRSHGGESFIGEL